jgi:hypothetical protein
VVGQGNGLWRTFDGGPLLLVDVFQHVRSDEYCDTPALHFTDRVSLTSAIIFATCFLFDTERARGFHSWSTLATNVSLDGVALLQLTITLRSKTDVSIHEFSRQAERVAGDMASQVLE